jgi:hypothetical protein
MPRPEYRRRVRGGAWPGRASLQASKQAGRRASKQAGRGRRRRKDAVIKGRFTTSAVAARLWAPTAAVILLLAAGCTAGPAARRHPPLGAVSYWDRARLLGALPFESARERGPLPGRLASPHTAGLRAGLRVGALFEHNAAGNHFCTASVVSSPGKDLLITAAHCLNGGKGGSGYNSDIVFVPDYRDGQEPFGVWTPAKLLVAPQWADSSDPEFDVGFVVLQQPSPIASASARPPCSFTSKLSRPRPPAASAKTGPPSCTRPGNRGRPPA